MLGGRCGIWQSSLGGEEGGFTAARRFGGRRRLLVILRFGLVEAGSVLSCLVLT